MKHYANFIALTGIPSFRVYEILDSGAFVAVHLKNILLGSKTVLPQSGFMIEDFEFLPTTEKKFNDIHKRMVSAGSPENLLHVVCRTDTGELPVNKMFRARFSNVNNIMEISNKMQEICKKIQNNATYLLHQFEEYGFDIIFILESLEPEAPQHMDEDSQLILNVLGQNFTGSCVCEVNR